MKHLLFIPGIGGHPLFHANLIDRLSASFHVHSIPHGDFFGRPYERLDSHVRHWQAYLDRLAGEDVTIVAISFGGQIVPSLLQNSKIAVKRVVLVSPWMVNRPAKLVLGLLSQLPYRFAGGLTYRLLTTWTNRSTSDRAAVDTLRLRLYDSNSAVGHRWLARFLGIRDGLTFNALEEVSVGRMVFLLFGDRELLYRLQARRLRKYAMSSRLKIRCVSGTHAVSSADSAELASLIASCCADG